MSAEQKNFSEYRQRGVDLFNWLRTEINYPEGITKANVYEFEREYLSQLRGIEASLMASFYSGEITDSEFSDKCSQLDDSDKDISHIIRAVKESLDDAAGGFTFFVFGDDTRFGFGKKRR